MAAVKALQYVAGGIFIATSLLLVYSDFSFNRNMYPISFMRRFRNGILNVDKQPSDRKKLPWWQKYFCDRRHGKDFGTYEGTEVLDVLQRDVTPDETSNNIFFIETSCKLYPKLRDLCAIESWARKHPNTTVWYVLNSPHIFDAYGHLGRVRDIYPNIKPVAVDLDFVFRNTPLWSLFESKKWMSDENLAGQQLGNMLRVALVWRFGGTYSDTDIICLKDTSNLHNAVGFYDVDKLNNANLQGSSPRLNFYWKLMEYINNNFQMSPWGHNGPYAITETALKYCNKTNLAEGRLPTTITLTCDEMNFLSEEVFNIIHFGFTSDLFEKDESNSFDANFDNSFGIHFWNKVSRDFIVGLNSPYEVAAMRHCPTAYGFSVSPPSF